MDIKLTYVKRAPNGVLVIEDPRLIGLGDHNLEVTVRRARRSKSVQQGRYLWAVVYEYALQGFKDLGHQNLTKDDLHEYFKDKFLSNGKEIVDPSTGEMKQIAKTTTTLTTTEMMDYVAQIVQFCAEWLNTVIPDPHEQVEMFENNQGSS